MYLFFRIYKTWKCWAKSTIKWKNIITASAVYFIACLAMVYTSVEWQDSILISSSKVTTTLLMSNMYMWLVLWLFTTKPLPASPERSTSLGRTRSELRFDDSVVSGQEPDNSVSYERSFTNDTGKTRAQILSEKTVRIKMDDSANAQV